MFSMPRSMNESTSSMRMSPSSLRLARPMRSRSTAAISDSALNYSRSRVTSRGALRLSRMRAATVLVALLVVACSGQTAGPGRSPSPQTSTATVPGSQLSTGGVVEYAVPDPAKMPADCAVPCLSNLGTLTPGPDANVWFVDGGRGQLGRVTPSGAFAQFLLPNPAGGAHTLVKGPDGNVWVIARGIGAANSP